MAKIIITGHHSDETHSRFTTLAEKDILFAEKPDDLSEEDCRNTEIFAGSITPELVSKMPHLRFVQLFSAGASSYGWLKEDIVLANAYGAYGDSIAEHMIAVTMMAMKRLPEYLIGQDEERWDLIRDIQRFDGSRILSVGMGAIGSAFLKKSHALGALCYGIRKTEKEKPSFVQEVVLTDDMDQLLPEMDVVALSLPGTDEVKGMFSERRLRLMKKDAILINVGRGNAVVTEDLIKVMNEGRLKAALLDVMDPEPLSKGHPLWKTPRVYLTPHISGGYKAGVNYEKVVDVVYQNIKLVLEGKNPVHIVDRVKGY